MAVPPLSIAAMAFGKKQQGVIVESVWWLEFYTTMLGFINFRLYHSLNLAYPPAIPGSASSFPFRYGQTSHTGVVYQEESKIDISK